MPKLSKSCRWLKVVDQTGYPVSLNWKKEKVHRTHLGGICSILTTIFVGLFMIGLFSQYFRFNQYDQLTLEERTETHTNDDCSDPIAKCMTMNNTQWIPFVTIGDFNSNKVANLSAYVIPQFWTYQKFLNGTEKTQFYDAIPCSQIFANTTDESLKDELIPLFNGSEWWCPDLKNITLNNDPFAYFIGQNFNFVVNFCDVAAAAKGADNSTCETDRTLIQDYIDKCRISHKFIRNYFNPKDFSITQTMSYIAEYKLTADFQRNVTPKNIYDVIQNLVTFYSNKFIDLSVFDFINTQKLEHNFYTT